MPIVDCGFPDTPSASGDLLLVRYGPTLTVRVGFDPTFNPGSKVRPQLPDRAVNALVDTGAMTSCIDTNLVKALNLPFVDRRDFGGIDGASERPIHLAQIEIPDLAFTIYGRFAAVNLVEGGQSHEVLLGRNFLIRFRMVYDGRSGEVIIENESTPAP